MLFTDSVVFRARGDSWMRSHPREFVLLALVSIPLWLVFELYNQFIRNWYYTGLPENWLARQFGYAWSFATIWPAIFEGADLVAVVRARSRPAAPAPPARPALPVPHVFSIAAGALCLAAPFVVPPRIAAYLAAPVWLGFIMLLDPINDRLGGESIVGDLRNARYDRLFNLMASGLLCGVLWEFWN